MNDREALDAYLRRRLDARVAAGTVLDDAPDWVVALVADPTYRHREGLAFQRRYGRPIPTLRELNVAATVYARVSESSQGQAVREWCLDVAARDQRRQPAIRAALASL